MWSVLEEVWDYYFVIFTIQSVIGMGYLATAAEWSEGILKSIVGVWADASPIIITAAAISFILVEPVACRRRRDERRKAERLRHIGIGIEIGKKMAGEQ